MLIPIKSSLLYFNTMKLLFQYYFDLEIIQITKHAEGVLEAF